MAQPETEQVTPTLDLREFLRAVRAYWAGAVSIVLVCVAIAALWTLTQPRVWTSVASGVVQTSSGGDAGLALAADNLAKSKAKTYVELAKSQAVAESAAAAIGAASAGALLASVTPYVADDSSIIEINASASTPDGARTLADAWIAAMTEQVELLENPDGAIRTQSTSFVPVAAATTPGAPSSPNILSALVVGGVVGLVGAGIYLIVRNTLDRRVRSAETVERTAGVPVIGTLIRYEPFDDGRRLATAVLPLKGPERRSHFAITEGIRELRTNLAYVSVDDPPAVIVVVSASPGEGKSTVSANLADAVAAAGRPVIIVDCDLRKPMLASIYEMEGAVGLTDVLAGRATMAQVAQRVPGNLDLTLFASGPTPPNPSELLGSRAMKDFLVALRSTGALVILDAPPLLAVTDGAVLSTIADGVIMTVDAASSTQDQLQRAVGAIRRVGGKILGVVLNRVPERGPDAQYYGYYGQRAYYASTHKPRAVDTSPPSAARAEPAARTVAVAAVGASTGPAPDAPVATAPTALSTVQAPAAATTVAPAPAAPAPTLAPAGGELSRRSRRIGTSTGDTGSSPVLSDEQHASRA